MTIAKQLNRKKRNQKLFNKLMAFYFAIVSISACGYLTALADNSEYSFETQEIVSSDLAGIISIRNFFSDIFRPMGFGILKLLARLISYFEDALNTLLHLTLYELIKKIAKIDIRDSWSYPIAWTVLGVSLVFVAVLLIFNADKARLTDFGRGIIITCILVIALPALINAFSDMRTKGIDAANSIRGDSGYAISENGKVNNATLGQQLLADNIIDVELSVKNRKVNKEKTLMYYSDNGYFKNNPKNVFDLAINSVSDNIHQKIGFSSPVITIQNEYKNLDEKTKILLCGSGTEELYNQYKDGYSVAKDNYEKYKNKTDEERNSDKYHPHTLKRKRWTSAGNEIYTYLDEETKVPFVNYMHLNSGEKARWAEYGISECMVNEAIYKLYYARVITGEPTRTYFNSEGFGGGELGQLYRNAKNDRLDIQQTIKQMENIKLQVGDYNFNVIEWLNISNNLAIVTSNNSSNSGNVMDDTKVKIWSEDLYSMKDYKDENMIDKLAILIKTFGYKEEKIYKYDYNFWFALTKLLCIAVCIFFAGLKVASTLYDILFAEIIAPIVVASDMNNSGRAKQVIQNLFSSYLVLIIVVLLLRIYLLVIYTISKDTSILNNNLAAELMLIIAGAKFVIDGPDLVVKIIGLDAGVKSGLGTVMGVRTAASMAHGAAHTAVHNPVSRAVGGAAGGAVGGGATGGFGGMVSGAIGGAFSGAFGGGHGGSAYSRGVHTGERVGNALMNNHSNNNGSGTGGGTSGGQVPQNRNVNAGGHGGNNGNNANTGGTGGHSGGAGGNTTVIAGGKGEKGDTGAKGDKGDKGDRGDMGMQGRQGEKGEDANKNEGFAQRELRNEQMRGHGLDD